jgi:DNA-binding MurR/RpiR family transcriptional regulator
MESALFDIRQHLPTLPAKERRIAACVLGEPRKALHWNITELARQSGVSQAAIVRFCHRLGMKGFSDFKLRLSQDVFRISDEKLPPDLELDAGMGSVRIVKGVTRGIQQNMARLESICDVHLLEQAADSIRKARFIGIFGIGASGLVAQDLYQKLIRTGFLCTAPQDTDLQITAAVNLRTDDDALILSYSGETPAALRCKKKTKKNKACLITLTMEAPNSLRSLADIPLLVPSLEPVYRSGATVSRLNQLAVVDMIHFLLLSKNMDGAARVLEQTMTAIHLSGS